MVYFNLFLVASLSALATFLYLIERPGWGTAYLSLALLNALPVVAKLSVCA